MSEQLHLSEVNAGDYLRGRGLLGPGERAALEPAGEGNINWVRRVRISPGGRSLVLKQARPRLERFPEYEAPTERIVMEARYYDVARRWDAGSVLPQVLDFDERERVLVLEDLGDVERLDQALARGHEVRAVAEALGRFLGAVHAATREQPGLADRFANPEMRRLHGDHIFALPFRTNEFPLTARLRERAERVWKDPALVACADEAYVRYLERRRALVHGDVQGGNVLLTPSGPKLLDAEIAHAGDPAFDLGILLAHLSVDRLATGRPPGELPGAAWRAYAAGGSGLARFEEAARYAGIELLRRTIGAARVPAVAHEEAGCAVLDVALRWIRRPPTSPEELA